MMHKKAYEKVLRLEDIPVRNILEAPEKLESLTGEVGFDNLIINKHLYRPQLALAGYLGLFNYKSIQIIGNTEYFFLKSLSKSQRNSAFENLCKYPIPCIILTSSHTLEQELIDIAINNKIAIFKTNSDTTKTLIILTEFLDNKFATQAVVHGSFVDVFGCGVLFSGRSGIGKSEIALDLIERGHRLVADDAVMLTKKHDSVLMGTGTNIVQHFMEIRGVGIIDIQQMFGIRAIRFQKRLEIIVELMDWDSNEEYTRIGLDEYTTNIMDVGISTVKLPIFPGKNITVIAEVISMNYLLQTYGYKAAEILQKRQQEEIYKNMKFGDRSKDRRNVNWFHFDSE